MLNFIQKKWKTMSLVLICGLFLFYFGFNYAIDRQVQNVVALAQESCPGDAVTSLLAVVNSDSFPLVERNRAVWALGRLGDPQALTSLEALHTGEECDHTSGVCQHELDKAIELCLGG